MKTIRRPIRIEGDIAYVPLTKGYVAIIDVEDVPLVEGKNWTALVSRRPDGSVRSVYAIRTKGPRRNLQYCYLHRDLMSAPPELQVAHKDGDGLNCRRRGKAGNLRLATNAQNGRNLRIKITNTSGIPGVDADKRRGGWRARIMLDGVELYLGTFKCRTGAAVAYMKASRKHHGDFGRTAHGQERESTGSPRSLQNSVSGSPIQPA